MKDNYVILKEYYDEEDGIAYVFINTPLGEFFASTSPDEIDAKYKSRFHASEIVLAKALRKFAESAVNQLKREVKLLEGMLKQSTDFANGPEDIDNNSFRIINGTLKQKKKDLKKWQDRVDNLTNSITERIAARDRIVANYIQKDKNN